MHGKTRIDRRSFLKSGGHGLIGLALHDNCILGSVRNSEQSPGEWAVRASWLIDGLGTAPARDGFVLVENDVIKAVGLAAQLPRSIPVLSFDGMTVLPGLIDTHNHPTLKPIGIGNGASDYLQQFRDPEALLAARASRNLRIDLLGGVTTARVVGELSFVDVTMAKAVQEGLVPGPRLLPSGPRLGPTGGHVWIPEWAVDGPDNIRRVVKQYFEKGARLIKIGLLDETRESTSYSMDELKAVVEQAHGLGMPVTAHCTGRWGSSIRLSLRAGVDAIEHVTPLNEEIIQEFLRFGAAMSITPFVYKMGWPQPPSYWHYQDFEAHSAEEWMNFNSAISKEYVEKHPKLTTTDRYFGKEVFPALTPWMETVRQAWEAGVPLAVGSDAPHGVLPLSVEFLVDCGIPPMGAISAATRVAARICGLEKQAGTLTPGKKADFIVVKGNPADDIRLLRKVHVVVRDGIRFEKLSFS